MMYTIKKLTKLFYSTARAHTVWFQQKEVVAGVMGGKVQKKIVLAANQAIIDNRLGPANYMQLADGLEAQENDGLDIEDRKRRRSGLESNTVMDVEGHFLNQTTKGDFVYNRILFFLMLIIQ